MSSPRRAPLRTPLPAGGPGNRWRSALIGLLTLCLLATACTSGLGGDSGDAGGAGDPAGGGDESGAEAVEATIDLALRAGPFQLSVDERPELLSRQARIEVRSEDGTALATADFAENGTALLRGLEPGAAEVVVLDRDTEYLAGSIDIPADADDPSIHEATGLEAGFNYIPTRDGTTLSAFVTLPGSAIDGPYPTLVEYSGYSPSNPSAADDPFRLLVPALGYALVQVNVRGTGCSGGSFDAFERIQSYDGYDVIETVASQPWADNVGMFGVSYPGIMQLHVASTRPPSLAAIAPLSVIDRVESVLYPGGIYNNGFGETWTDQVGARAVEEGQEWAAERITRGDRTCAANQRFRTHNPDLVEVIQESPFVSDLSIERSPETWASDIDVPVFLAGAWQDEQTGPRFPALIDELADNPGFRAVLYNGLHIDAVGPDTLVKLLEFYDIYVAEEDPTVDPLTQALIGVGLGTILGQQVELPAGEYAGLGPDEARARFEADPPIRIQLEQGAEAPNLPVAGFELAFDQWPPAETVATVFHLGETGLNPEPPEDEVTFEFETDPTEGARTTIEGLDTIWTVEPGWQWPAGEPGRAVTAATAPLEEDLVAIGNLSADLWVSLPAATDADLEVTVSEIGPDGSETYVQSGWLRLSRRELGDDATEFRPNISGLESDVAELAAGGDPVEARVEVLPFAHVFRAGSRLAITVDTPGGSKPQWRFDVLDEPVQVVIHAGPDTPSRIVVPTIPGVEVPIDRPTCGALRGQPCRTG